MNKKTLLSSFLFLILIESVSFAQTCKEPFLGSKTLYSSQQQIYTAPPPGFVPVFINHVGRHGSRHLTKDVNSSFIYQLLAKADSLNALSADGKLLWGKVLRLEKVEKKNFKSISGQGKTEQRGLADRMYANNSNVFGQARPVLHINYTKEIRTLQTSDAFVDELRTKINEPAISKQINDTTLRFYDLSPAYLAFKENGNWVQAVGQLKNTLHYNELCKRISNRFFTGSFANKMDADDMDKFVKDLFGFVTIFFSIQNEIIENGYKSSGLDMQSYFTCDELVTLSKIDNAEDFLSKGPGTDVNGIQVKIALPLLADFIKTTDDYIKTKTVAAQLRFSHAETIAPYAALLGFINASVATTKTTDIGNIWAAEKVIPLSSNIQWIIYRKKNTETYLVKFLLNEKEVAVNGLVSKTYPYYNWNDVRSFYIKKIQDFHAGIDTDYFTYLKNLQ